MRLIGLLFTGHKEHLMYRQHLNIPLFKSWRRRFSVKTVVSRNLEPTCSLFIANVISISKFVVASSISFKLFAYDFNSLTKRANSRLKICTFQIKKRKNGFHKC